MIMQSVSAVCWERRQYFHSCEGKKALSEVPDLVLPSRHLDCATVLLPYRGRDVLHKMQVRADYQSSQLHLLETVCM